MPSAKPQTDVTVLSSSDPEQVLAWKVVWERDEEYSGELEFNLVIDRDYEVCVAAAGEIAARAGTDPALSWLGSGTVRVEAIEQYRITEL